MQNRYHVLKVSGIPDVKCQEVSVLTDAFTR